MKRSNRGARSAKVDARSAPRTLRRHLAALGLAIAVMPGLSLSLDRMERLAGHASSPLPDAMLTLSALADTPEFEENEQPSPFGAGALYVRDDAARVPAERGGRVSPTRLDPVQPRFAAGRMVDPAGLLRPGIALGDDEMRTALAGPQPAGERLLVAGSFRTPAADIGRVQGVDDPVQVASLGSRSRPASSMPAASEPASRDALETLAAYAPAGKPGSGSLFDAVLDPAGRGFVPPIGEKDHSWAASVLPASSFTAKEQTCLANGIYFEARGESELGQAAVAQVILNRVRNPTYPKTICGVVYQNKDWKNRCQFSFACDGIKDVIWNKRAYGAAKRIALEVTQGETWLPEVGSATHYHATYVKPRWAATMQKVDKIGLHVFYRTFGGGWR